MKNCPEAEILVLMDADMTAHQDYVKNLIAPILNKTAKGTFTLEEHVGNSGDYMV